MLLYSVLCLCVNAETMDNEYIHREIGRMFKSEQKMFPIIKKEKLVTLKSIAYLRQDFQTKLWEMCLRDEFTIPN